MKGQWANKANDIKSEKKELRRVLLDALNALPEAERFASDDRIRRQIYDMPEYMRANSIFIFVGTGWEVDTRPLVEEALAAGKTVCVPRCLPGGVMEACLIRSTGELRQIPPMGLWEPLEGTPVIPPSDIDFAIIPCIACDKYGFRLGRGGGYYDRFLKGGRFVKTAICRTSALQEKLPIEAHDESVNFILTEKGILTPLSSNPSGRGQRIT